MSGFDNGRWMNYTTRSTMLSHWLHKYLTSLKFKTSLLHSYTKDLSLKTDDETILILNWTWLIKSSIYRRFTWQLTWTSSGVSLIWGFRDNVTVRMSSTESSSLFCSSCTRSWLISEPRMFKSTENILNMFTSSCHQSRRLSYCLLQATGRAWSLVMETKFKILGDSFVFVQVCNFNPLDAKLFFDKLL